MAYLYPVPIPVLSRPFPAVRSTRKAVVSAFAFGAFVGFFLYFFEPFGLGELERGLPRVALGYGAVTTLGMLFMQPVWPRFFPTYYSEDDWTVGREIAHTLGNILLIAGGNVGFTAFMGFASLSVATFLIFLGFTLVVGAFPVTVGVLLRQNACHRRYLAESEAYNVRIAHHTGKVRTEDGAASAKNRDVSPAVRLQEDAGGREFSCLASELIAVEAADNYVKLHLHRAAGDARKTELLRLTTAAAEEALGPHRSFFRCHRSWLVNLDRLENVEGNARGYRLHLQGMKEPVPVSRSRIEAFRGVMEGSR